MWIGVISDTAGVLMPGVVNVFDGVDYILHCGNIGNPTVLEELSQIAPITGVIGGSDSAEVYPFERTLYRKWFETGIYMHHRIGDPTDLHRNTQKAIDAADPQVILFGSTGEPFNTRIESRLFFNPGAAGRRRPKQPRTVGLLEISGHSVRAEIVPIDEGAAVT
ncbi:MAG: hypothetical protein CMJ90_01200 [Planctomycetes bacterium]|nr:hypothetical protein [Planctomycetota bacterium]